MRSISKLTKPMHDIREHLGKAHRLSCLLVEEFFCFVDLCRKVRAAASIGVVEEHEGAVGLADFFLCDGAFAAVVVSMYRSNSYPVLHSDILER
jgi:hypothetical protein